MSERILVVLPHPDDEAFGLSGTLAKFVAEGAHVTYACLTLGQMARAFGNPPIANRETLPAIRKQELIAACRVIGIQDLRMLGFHDKTVEFEPFDKIDAVISEIIDEVKPTLIMTFLPGYSVHPDHDATGASVIRVIERLPQEKRPPVWCIAFAHNVVEHNGEPNIVVDIKDYLLVKRNAIAAHTSQFQISQLFGLEEIYSDEVIKRFGEEKFWLYKFNS